MGGRELDKQTSLPHEPHCLLEGPQLAQSGGPGMGGVVKRQIVLEVRLQLVVVLESAWGQEELPCGREGLLAYGSHEQEEYRHAERSGEEDDHRTLHGCRACSTAGDSVGASSDLQIP